MIWFKAGTPFETICIFKSGKSFFDYLYKAFEEAKEEIHLQTYIIEADQTGFELIHQLKKAAARNIKVFLLADAYGSRNLTEDVIQDLQKSGVEVKLYGRLFNRGKLHLGRRLHRKVIVIDQKKAFVMGINFSNNYNDLNNHKAWFDFAVEINGPAVFKLHSICLQRWLKKRFRRLPKAKEKLIGSFDFRSQIKVRQNDFVRGLNEVAATYKREIKNAEDSILIVGGYFLPGGRMRRHLRLAAKRGVRIQVLLAAESDSTLVKNSVQYLYNWFLRNNISIFEYLDTNVHGKVLITDRKFVSIGSFDFNNLSTYSNIELNLDIHNPAFASDLHSRIEKVLKEQCRQITKEELKRRFGYFLNFKNWLSFQLSKTLFVLSVWLTTKDDDDEYQ